MNYLFSYINEYDNKLYQYRVSGDTWKEAYVAGFEKYYDEKCPGSNMTEDFARLPDSLEQAHALASEGGFQFGLLELDEQDKNTTAESTPSDLKPVYNPVYNFDQLVYELGRTPAFQTEEYKLVHSWNNEFIQKVWYLIRDEDISRATRIKLLSVIFDINAE